METMETVKDPVNAQSYIQPKIFNSMHLIFIGNLSVGPFDVRKPLPRRYYVDI